MGDIKRLLPRLKSLNFRQHFPEMVQDIKPAIIAGTAACEEVKSGVKFNKILELILLFGNYMNSGSRNGQAYGFEINFLPKVCAYLQSRTFVINVDLFFCSNSSPQSRT